MADTPKTPVEPTDEQWEEYIDAKYRHAPRPQEGRQRPRQE